MANTGAVLVGWALGEGVIVPNTMHDFVQLLGGAGRGGGTSKAAGELGITQREVQRILASERAVRGENAAGQRRGLTESRQLQMRVVARRVQFAARKEEIRAQGITVRYLQGHICVSADCRDRIIQPRPPTHIPGSVLEPFVQALDQRDEAEAADEFGAVYGEMYCGSAMDIQDVTRLDLVIGRA